MVHLIRGDQLQLRTDHPIRVAGYFSLDGQTTKKDALRMLRLELSDRYCGANMWQVTAAYFDIGQQRDAFHRMIEDAKAGAFDLILSDSIDRFTPSAEETIACVEDLKALLSPVDVFFMCDGFGSDTIISVAPIVRGWRP